MAKVFNYEEEVITDRSDAVSTQKYYVQWSQKYESDMKEGNYNAPAHAVDAFAELNLDKQTKILDVLAGTGLVGSLLRQHGYTNIDAIDGSREMLRLAEEKQLYRHYHVSLLGGQHAAPFDDDTYDAIISSGSFAPGHLYPDVLADLIRIVRKGGFIVWSMRQGYEQSSPAFANFDNEVNRLVSMGLWRHNTPRKEVDEYMLGSKGYVYIMQKI